MQRSRKRAQGCHRKGGNSPAPGMPQSGAQRQAHHVVVIGLPTHIEFAFREVDKALALIEPDCCIVARKHAQAGGAPLLRIGRAPRPGRANVRPCLPPGSAPADRCVSARDHGTRRREAGPVERVRDSPPVRCQALPLPARSRGQPGRATARIGQKNALHDNARQWQHHLARRRRSRERWPAPPGPVPPDLPPQHAGSLSCLS